jgi:hypothetical protein
VALEEEGGGGEDAGGGGEARGGEEEGELAGGGVRVGWRAEVDGGEGGGEEPGDAVDECGARQKPEAEGDADGGGGLRGAVARARCARAAEAAPTGAEEEEDDAREEVDGESGYGEDELQGGLAGDDVGGDGEPQCGGRQRNGGNEGCAPSAEGGDADA